MIIDDILAEPVRNLKLVPLTDSETADACGRLRFYERQLADLRRTLIAETGEQSGTDYEIVDRGTWKYSFNDQGILSDVMLRCDVPPFEALRMLRDAGAAVVTFKKSGLDTFYKSHRIGLHTVQGEAVEDGDAEAPRMGRVWKQRLSAEPKEE